MNEIETVQINIEDLKANDYNPNMMTDEEFTELVKEVKHLERVPKPVVVRRNAQGYEIVDGEQSWKAAKEAELREVTCEIIKADDFEAMRQTYKRNQHGTHDPVRQGRMFKRMLGQRNISQRQLAEEVEISEGTIRNSLLYAKLQDEEYDGNMPNGIWERGGHQWEEWASCLSVKQVRWYFTLPRAIGKAWLEGGANIKHLEQALKEKGVYVLARYDTDIAKEYFSDGIADYLDGYKKNIKEAIKDLIEKRLWEKGWCRGGIDREDFRKYARLHYMGHRQVKSSYWMDRALALIIDGDTLQFLVTPEEFEEIVGEKERKSGDDFFTALQLKVIEKHGNIVVNQDDRDAAKQLQAKLNEIELQKAPAYYRDPEQCGFCKRGEKYCKGERGSDEKRCLNFMLERKVLLFQAGRPKEYGGEEYDKVFEEAKREILKTGKVIHFYDNGWNEEQAINCQVRFNIEQLMAKDAVETSSEEEAKAKREQLLNGGASFVFDKEKSPGKWSEYRNKLAVFSNAELFFLLRGMSYLSYWIGAVGELAQSVGKPGPLIKEAKAAMEEVHKDA